MLQPLALSLPDWHPADIQAALSKRGHRLARLSVAHGYHATAAAKALRRAWPALERIIADALDQTPQAIWPSRYQPDGTPQYQRRHKFDGQGGIDEAAPQGRARESPLHASTRLSADKCSNPPPAAGYTRHGQMPADRPEPDHPPLIVSNSRCDVGD